jgi:hypothetical protein
MRGPFTAPFRSISWAVLQRVWYVHEFTVLTVQATPAMCFQTMLIASKPSVDRLQLRDLFNDGRRYYLQPRENGFRMTCNSSLRWRYRRRTGEITVLTGAFEPIGNGGTRISIRARISVPYLLDVFWLPLFMTTIIPFVLRWAVEVRIGALIALYVLSWASHRAHAQLQAVEMLYFINRVLEEFGPAIIPELQPSTANVVDQRPDFMTEWEKFYREHKAD